MSASNMAPARRRSLPWWWFIPAVVAACWFVAGLALSRLLFEGLFPAWPLMGRPAGALALGVTLAGLGVAAAMLVAKRAAVPDPTHLAASFLPLLINLAWLFDLAVNP
ncbi:MAG TPA: hypothetical protein PLR07_03430, partial [Promineifilum sp.]|nr:hypothetical protein [Promineifilum sp.]